MKSEVPALPSLPPQSLDQLLTSAVVLSWDAVTQSSPSGRVRVEYHIGTDGALEYLKLWCQAREYWSLICEYSTHASWSDGPRFCNGFHSRLLSRLLQSIMTNQQQCSHTCKPNSNGTLEIGPPAVEDVEAANLCFSAVLAPTIAAGKKRGGEARLLSAES